jgi:hypothetical protein
VGVQAPQAARDRAVGVGKDPRRRALKDVQARDLRPDLRPDLDRRRAGPDERDALPGALEHDEVVDALLLEPDRHAEPAEAGTDDRDLDLLR